MQSRYNISYLALSLPKKQCASVLLAYATHFLQCATVVFSNGVITLNNGGVEEQKPRGIFDRPRRFSPPPKELLFEPSSSNKLYDLSLTNMIVFSIIHRQEYFDDKQFTHSIKASHLILDVKLEDHKSDASA